MTIIEIAVSFLGRRLTILTITKKEIMASEKLVLIKITNAFGIGYAKGRVYEVSPDEAKKLIEAQKAIAWSEEKENAAAKKTGVEKR